MKKIKLFVAFTAMLLLLSFSKNNDTDIWKQYQLQNPESLILTNFETHDIIFLGEPHHVKQHLRFLQKLLPQLYKNGVTNLGYEFLPYDRQHEIDSLLTAEKFNEAFAAQLMASHYFEWGFKDYVDVMYTVWQLNKSQAKGKMKFRIIGLGNSSIWTKDRHQKWTEKDWAGYLLKEVIAKNQKALVYCGTHHALTKFQQPYFDKENNKYGLANKDRCGHYIFVALKERTMTIWLHDMWPDTKYELTVIPCYGFLDSLYRVIKKPFAFNTTQSSLGNLKDTASVYAKGYLDFRLKQVADAMIVLNPVCEDEWSDYVSVVNDKNIQQINQQTKYYYHWPEKSVREIEDTLISWYRDNKTEFEQNRKKYCYQK